MAAGGAGNSGSNGGNAGNGGDAEKLANSHQQNYLHNSNISQLLKSNNDQQKMNIVSTPNEDNVAFYDMKRKIEMENLKPKNTFIYSKYPVGLEAIKEITKNKISNKPSNIM